VPCTCAAPMATTSLDGTRRAWLDPAAGTGTPRRTCQGSAGRSPAGTANRRRPFRCHNEGILRHTARRTPSILSQGVAVRCTRGIHGPRGKATAGSWGRRRARIPRLLLQSGRSAGSWSILVPHRWVSTPARGLYPRRGSSRGKPPPLPGGMAGRTSRYGHRTATRPCRPTPWHLEDRGISRLLDGHPRERRSAPRGHRSSWRRSGRPHPGGTANP
jgi:hypothetical protein